MYKVLIPSAGLGTRLGDIGKNINKALVSVANKPVISHVIEKFPKDVEIVVAIGHKGQLLKDYLEVAHPDRKITCVEIEHYHGSKSGLGYTILQCEQHLQCPFQVHWKSSTLSSLSGLHLQVAQRFHHQNGVRGL